jgi:hypothetical protein
LDVGEAGSARRAVFELCCEFQETRIWDVADKRGLRAALEDFLGRGPMSAAELKTATEEFYHPLTAEEFCAKVAAEGLAELQQAIVEAALSDGVPCPPWADRLNDLRPEELPDVESWLAVHLADGEQDPVALEPATNAQQTILRREPAA